MPSMRKLKGHRGDVYAVLIFQKWLFSAGYDKTIRVWNVFTGQHIRSLTGHSSLIRSLTAIPPSLSVASASWDNTIKLWNIRSGALLCTLEGHTNRVKSVMYHQLTPQRGYLVSGSDDCTLKLWDTETCRAVRTFSSHSQPVLCVAVAEKKGHSIIASGSADHSVQLFSLEQEQEQEGRPEPTSTQGSFLTLGGHQGPVTAVVFSDSDKDREREGATLFSCSEDMTILLWDCVTGSVLQQLLGHTKPCQSLSVFAHQTTDSLIPTRTEYLVSTSLDGSVRIWNTTSCAEEKKLDFTGGYLFNAAVGGGPVPGAGAGSSSPLAVKESVLVISGDDGCVYLYPSFVESYLSGDSRAVGGAGGKGAHPLRRGRGGDSLPVISRGGKTLAVRLPGKQLFNINNNNSNDNNDNDNNASNPSEHDHPLSVNIPLLAMQQGQGGGSEPRKTHSRAGVLLAADGSASARTEGNASLGGGGGDPAQPAGALSLSHPPQHTHNSAQKALQRNSRNHPRVRAVHPRGPRQARAGTSDHRLGGGGSASARGSSSRRGKKSTLPALQRPKKEFICVTSQYAQPPEVLSGVVGLLNCNSLTSCL